MSIFEIKRNDTLPQLRATLLDSTGAPLNLTGAAVVFRMRAKGSAVLKINAAATVVSALLGTVAYTWQTGDTDTLSTYDAEWVLTYSNGVQTVPTSGYLAVKVSAALS